MYATKPSAGLGIVAVSGGMKKGHRYRFAVLEMPIENSKLTDFNSPTEVSALLDGIALLGLERSTMKFWKDAPSDWKRDFIRKPGKPGEQVYFVEATATQDDPRRGMGFTYEVPNKPVIWGVVAAVALAAVAAVVAVTSSKKE